MAEELTVIKNLDSLRTFRVLSSKINSNIFLKGKLQIIGSDLDVFS